MDYDGVREAVASAQWCGYYILSLRVQKASQACHSMFQIL